VSGDAKEPHEPSPDAEGRTVFMPSRPGEPTAPPPRTATPFQTAFAPRTDGQRIQVGDVLNHIFEVKRFIARGGMGEVFEGANVNSDEKVAIKVMLPALAADPSVISMFRKEARTLTRLNHPALVSYRVLAQEPQLGVLYIVTEYIDGTNLADELGRLKPGSDELVALLRRLAEGLRAAHQLGAIHRDISPDNVLLEEGRLDRAKIIDFGIAKDIDPGSATIVGEGFAGKLSYVAPEQLGDFGRDVGPWTDVYSLGLVMLAVAQGRSVAMGGSLVDAVDKRRAGPDLTGLPGEIRPVLESMLRANPAERLRSMDEVLAMLDLAAIPHDGADKPRPPGPVAKRGVMIGAAVAGVLLLALLGWLVLGRAAPTPVDEDRAPAAQIAGAGRDPVAVARSAVDAVLPSVSCTWLDIVDISPGSPGPRITLTGVAGNPSSAQSEIARALQQQKVSGADIDFGEVAQITQSGCAVLDAYRQVRAPGSRRLSVPQRKFELRRQPADSQEPGLNAANAIINVQVGDQAQDFALVGLEPAGILTTVFPSRAAFTSQETGGGFAIKDLGGDRFRLGLLVDHAEWSGLLLLTGKGPFDPAVVAPPIGARGPDWTNRFVSAAAANGWQADMVWFKTVDEVKE
jgi:eukaryotic-like serine/threonine-protein kinase